MRRVPATAAAGMPADEIPSRFRTVRRNISGLPRASEAILD
jgi:hypothetical protein